MTKVLGFSKLCSKTYNRIYNNFRCDEYSGKLDMQSCSWYNAASLSETTRRERPLKELPLHQIYGIGYINPFSENHNSLSDIMYYAGNENKEYCSFDNAVVYDNSVNWAVYNR